MRARGPVDAELTDPSGVRVRGEQASMKACDPMGVISVEPGTEAGCHVCISKACCDRCADTLLLLLPTTCAKDVVNIQGKHALSRCFSNRR